MTRALIDPVSDTAINAGASFAENPLAQAAEINNELIEVNIRQQTRRLEYSVFKGHDPTPTRTEKYQAGIE